MRNLITLTLVVVLAVGAYAAPPTTYYSLAKPDDNAPSWGNDYRATMDTIDAALHALEVNKLNAGGGVPLTSTLVSNVTTGTAPFAVASTTLVTNLNSDLLDGMHSSSFLGVSATAADSSKLNGQLASYYATAASLSGYVTTSGTAYDSTRLNGQLSSYYATAASLAGYVTTTGTAYDSTRLNGQLASYYATAASLSGYVTTTGTAYDSTRLNGQLASYYMPVGGGNFTGAITRQTFTVWDSGNDGTTSGLDADLLDGNHAAAFALLSGAAFTGSITRGGNTVWDAGNDGTGSGLDADLLDGNHASAFSLTSHNHDTTYVNSSGDTAITGRLVSSGAPAITQGMLEVTNTTGGSLTPAIIGTSTGSASGMGLKGVATSPLVGYGVGGYGSSIGVYGSSSGTTSSAAGVYAYNNSAAGYGLISENAGGGTAIKALSTGQQLALHYDASIYTTLSTNASGYLTVTPTGGALNVVGVLQENGTSLSSKYLGGNPQVAYTTDGTVTGYNMGSGQLIQAMFIGPGGTAFTGKQVGSKYQVNNVNPTQAIAIPYDSTHYMAVETHAGASQVILSMCTVEGLETVAKSATCTVNYPYGLDGGAFVEFLSPSSFIILADCYNSGSISYIAAGTYSGGTITCGSPVLLGSGQSGLSGSNGRTRLSKLTSTTALVSYGANPNVAVAVATASGNSISIGTPYTTTSAESTEYIGALGVYPNSSGTKAMLITLKSATTPINPTFNYYKTILNISGTSVTSSGSSFLSNVLIPGFTSGSPVYSFIYQVAVNNNTLLFFIPSFYYASGLSPSGTPVKVTAYRSVYSTVTSATYDSAELAPNSPVLYDVYCSDPQRNLFVGFSSSLKCTVFSENLSGIKEIKSLTVQSKSTLSVNSSVVMAGMLPGTDKIVASYVLTSSESDSGSLIPSGMYSTVFRFIEPGRVADGYTANMNDVLHGQPIAVVSSRAYKTTAFPNIANSAVVYIDPFTGSTTSSFSPEALQYGTTSQDGGTVYISE